MPNLNRFRRRSGAKPHNPKARENMSKTLILCDCSGTQTIDKEGLEQATGLRCSRLHTGLCTTQTEAAAEAIAEGGAVFCCAQETRFFEELAGELHAGAPPCLDLRDRAGWSADDASKLPKMAALVAEATLPDAPEKTIEVASEGLCLIIGAGEVALNAAEQLSDFLNVTVLLTDGSDLPATRDFDVVHGRLRMATGALGGFTVTIDTLQQVIPSGHGKFALTEPRPGARSECDVILDLTGGEALFPAHEKREGYLRADPAQAVDVAQQVMQASHMTGVFEKPLYIKMEPLLCAHSRAEQTGCTNCLEICPTGAITSKGEHVSVDPMICAGCGACSSLCPSGAISYDAPPVDLTMRRTQVLATAYRDADGAAPRLLVHDGHGREMIALSARYGRGLPADVLPLELEALSAFGHAEMVAALAAGFADVTILLSPKTDRTALEREATLAGAIGGDVITLLDEQDPDLMSAALYGAEPPAPCASPVRPMGTRRQITRQAARALAPEAEILPLPADAPYGAVVVDTDSCTLCLSCVSLCPSGALGDNPDQPQLRFQEDACLQCGLCSNICPESAISYEPRLNLTDNALNQVVLHEEEPFACVECGALFGVKSTVEKVIEKLAGNHSMYQNADAIKMIQMCDNCRINAQYHSENNPFSGGERPRPRTTDDYLSKRRDH